MLDEVFEGNQLGHEINELHCMPNNRKTFKL